MFISRVFAVSGFSGTGKTTLVENIVKELAERGYSVGTVKSSKEDIFPPEGTDTYRHLKASAHPVVLLGPSSTIIRYTQRLPSAELLSRIDADIVVFEGFKSASVPRVLCVGDHMIEDSSIPNRTHAIVSWEPTKIEESISIPVLQSHEIDEIAAIILDHAVDSSEVDF
ncbi:MAG: molybdopterin-guanine dinucleotide biosynthesis protein B [Candidatus Thorarchaeota archaeon]